MSSRLTPTLGQLGGDIINTIQAEEQVWEGGGKNAGAILHVFEDLSRQKCQASNRMCESEDKKRTSVLDIDQQYKFKIWMKPPS